MKNIFALIGVVIVIGVAFSLLSIERTDKAVPFAEEGMEESNENESGSRSVVEDGSYVAVVEESSVSWAGQKPLVDGYVNSGSMELKSGSISVVDGVISGELVMDMNTLSVSETPTKPGSENALEGHLKGERWFNVSAFPEAKFVIREVVPQADGESGLMFDVVGDLTMKGETHELAFPAEIYTGEDGRTYASADLEFDRTKWGITAGSGSFFDNLADNVIDDMVALSFEVVTEEEGGE